MQNINEKVNIQSLHNIISSSVLYTTSDLDANITSVSKAFEKLTGYTEEELIGKNHSLFRNPETPDSFYEEMWDTLEKDGQFKGELKNYTKNKDIYWTSVTINSMYNDSGTKIGYVAYRENVTNTKKLEYISTHDTLTDIYNREYFDTTLNATISSSNRYQNQFSLIMLDIDFFKRINDTYGHYEGDKVLIKIASILKNNIRQDDILARWGGEEFVILVPHTKSDETFILAEKLRVLIENTSIVKKENITASFGVGEYLNGETKVEFFEKIDFALYKAKNKGRNLVIKA